MAEEEEKNMKPVLDSENERMSPKTEEQNISFFFFLSPIQKKKNKFKFQGKQIFEQII